MSKKLGVITGFAAAVFVATWLFGGVLDADTATPGSVNDPLASKSYVDLKIAELKELIGIEATEDVPSIGEEAMASEGEGLTLEEVKAYVEERLAAFVVATGPASEGDDGAVSIEPETLEDTETPADDSVATDNSALLFSVVEVEFGQQLICGASAEIILRAGNATVVAGINGDGLADLTDGTDLQGGAEVPAQHHLLVSRDDGRGIQITSEGTAYVMVKGAYTIQ